MIGKTHRPKRPGRRNQLPGDNSLYRQDNISEYRALAFELPTSSRKGVKGRSKAVARALSPGRAANSVISSKRSGLVGTINPTRKPPLTEKQRKVIKELRVFNKTLLILTLVIMMYDLTGHASAAEAPSSAGEIATSQSDVTTVKHDPVNFDQADPQVKPDVDSSIQPAFAAAVAETSDKGQIVATVDGDVKSAEEQPAPVDPAPVKPVYNAGTIVNQFPYGYCTWYVASKRPIPWNGNAGVWYSQALAYGFKVGNAPQVGAIMVTSESYLGHVAYVEAVNPDGSWVVSEMNYFGWGIISSRTIKPGTIPVIGFIY